MKCYLVLAALADITPLAENYFFKEANVTCTQLYEYRNSGEEEEILTYQNIIKESLADLGPEMR